MLPATDMNGLTRRIAGIAVLLPCMLVGASTAPAATLRVPAEHATIQLAISAASAGDVILIGAGTYYENLQLLGKSLTLRGESGADFTTIDGQQSGRVILFDGGGVVEGLKIRNGVSPIGAGIYVLGAVSATIKNCIIENNRALPFDEGAGGGVFLDLEHTGCLIEDNIIRNNYAGDSGGGVYDNGAVAISTIRRNSFIGNGCHVSGGAVSLAGTKFTENLVLRNWSDSFAGGIAGGGVLVANNTIVGNYNNNFFLHGAGIRITSPSTVIRHNLVAFNRGLPGRSTGAGIQAAGPVVCNDSWGNEGPNFLLSNTTGTGNISADPYFCDSTLDNYSISTASPCAPGVSACGMIGAFGAACGTTSVTSTSWGRLKSRYR